MKYSEWLKEWMENYVQLTVKTRTISRYSEIINSHISPILGDLDIRKITSRILQQFVKELSEKGNMKTGKALASNSVNSIITVLQGSLRVAYNLGMTSECAADKIMRPKIIEKSIECFSLSEQKKIEADVLSGRKDYLIGVVICLYTGLRLGELLALEWSDMDFQNAFLTVRRSCHYGKTKDCTFGRIIDTPKTVSSTRVIPLPKQIIPILKEYKKNSQSKLVISNGSKEISVRTYQRNFEVILKRSSISHRGFHALRHTFATRALECGMDVKTLSEILGHKSPTITLNRYAHSMLNHKIDMMNLVGNLLKK